MSRPNGRVVLPADVRKRLGLSEGGELADGGDLRRPCAPNRRAGGRPRAGDRASISADSPGARWTRFSHNAAPTAANDSEIVLDASALISMLRKEPGGEAVAARVGGRANERGQFRRSGQPFHSRWRSSGRAPGDADRADRGSRSSTPTPNSPGALAVCAGPPPRPASRLVTDSALRSAPGTDFRSGPRIGNGEPLPISWTWRLSSFASRPVAFIHDLPASRHTENPVWLERIWDNGSRHLISSINKA